MSFVALRSCDIHLCEMNLAEKAAVLSFVVTVSFLMRIFKFSNGNNNSRKNQTLGTNRLLRPRGGGGGWFSKKIFPQKFFKQKFYPPPQ